MNQGRDIAHFSEVLAFEHAAIRAALYGESSTVCFNVDPAELLDGLLAGRLTSDLAPGRFTLEVRAE